ncbi:NifU family protein [Lutibacter sp. TH_r2]|uniref:NifU family protein n=1 Tax=Lutibacter sp. TH_r2 TaxID=3082083 RepID=UPI0029550478|nr:NifU family protein [Lutibacter sp. TH_r2]MDV7187047.1 NifU family protein [Lutibacter sp. TH_r2]
MSNYSFNIETTNTDTIIKFISNEVLTSGSYQFNNIDEAKNSPLAQELFHLPFVKRIFISANFIAIERFDIVKWDDVQNEVKEQVENYLNNGGILLNEEQKKLPIEIYAETTPNPNVLKFVSNKILFEKDYEFKAIDETKNAPLAANLFNFPFVKEVFLSENYVSITKFDGVEWSELSNEVRSFIKEYISAGRTLVNSAQQATQTIKSSETEKELDEISLKIISILDEYIRPAVAADGGNIAFESYNTQTQTVNVVLQGACSGCPSSTITLKNGIENMLKQLIPGKIGEVVAINY